MFKDKPSSQKLNFLRQLDLSRSNLRRMSSKFMLRKVKVIYGGLLLLPL